MADFHRSLFSRGKISAGNAYDDVFGGPPKFAVSSFSSRVDDYSEIFGNFFGPKSSSIPLLDFPALEEDEVLFDARSTGFEYSEIFGGSEDAGFAFSCEEVFEERQGQEDASSNVRAQAETLPRQQCPAVVAVTPSKRYSETSHLIYNDTKQFNVSYNRRNQSEGDPLNGTTHIAQFHEVPGFTVVVDSLPPSPPAKGDKSLPKVNSDASLNEVSNGGILEQSHFGEAVSLAPISSCFIPSTENDLKADVKELDSTSTAPKDIPANAYFDLNYSSYHLPSELSENQNQLGLKSTTSEDAPASDLHQLHKLETHLPAGEDKTSKGEAFLTVADFNLVTQPSRLPPPSRPPPKLGRSKQVKAYPGEKCSWKPPRIYETYHSGPTFEIHTIEEGAKDGSSPLFDVEVDPSSAAAASTAVMREAMEKAQATINSAKESMERRRDNYQSRMKLRVNEDKTVKERRHRRTAPENQKFKEEDAQEASERNDREMKDCSRDEVQKVMIAAHVASNIEKKVGFMELTKESSDRSPWKEPGAPFMTQKKVDEAKEVKLEKQFLKPVNNDNESDVTAMIAECERNDMKAAKKNTVFENNEKLKAAQEASAREVSQKKLKPTKETHMQEEKMNLETSEEYPEPGENAKRPKADLNTSKVDGQKKLKEAKETHQHEADHTHKDNEMKLKSTKEAGELEENEQRLKAAREREDEEKRQKSTFERVESEKRTKAYCEEEEELKRLKASLERVEAEKRLKADWEIEEAEKRRKVARECEEEEKRLKAARERQEEEMRLQASLELEKEVNRLKVAREREEEEKRLKAAREREDEERRLKEALEHEKEVNRLKADHERAEEEEKTLKAALEHEMEVKRLKAAHEREEAKRLKETQECEEEERRLKAALEQEKEMKRLKIARDHEEEKRSKTACEWEEVEKGLKTTYVREVEDKMLKANLEEDDKKIEGVKKVHDSGESSNKLKANEEANEWEESEKNTKEASMFVEKKLKLKLEDNSEKLNKCHVAKENKESKKITKVVNEVSEHDTFEQHLEAAKIACELDENRKALKSAQEPHKLEVIVKKLEVTHEDNGHEDPKEEMDGTRAVPLDDNGGEKKLGETLEASVWEDQERKPKIPLVVNEVGESEQNLKMVKEGNDFVKNVQSTNDFEILSQGVLLGAQSEMKVELPPMDTVCNGKEKVLRTAPQVFVNKGKDREEKIMNEIHKQGEREKEEKQCKERELELVRQKKIEEEREREREREKDRIAVERAVREARDRAFVEARERAERAAVERVTTEARQRAQAEARERAEKSSLAEKAAIEASRTRAERAAVERATAEARDRAVEKAMAERAALREKPDGGMRQNRSSSDSWELHSTDGDSAKRCKARLERHQRTAQRAAKALAEKNIRDILAQREQIERNRLAETLDADIKRWSNGKEGNLRALLSTLQYILGPESGWQPIPLTAVITAVAVKKAYRKATLCVHPDKVQQRGAGIQQKYICEKVFDLLKEAWNKFNSEER